MIYEILYYLATIYKIVTRQSSIVFFESSIIEIGSVFF